MESMCGVVVYHRSGRWVSARADDPSRLVASIAAVIASGSEFIGDGIEVIDSQRGTATKGGVTLDPRTRTPTSPDRCLNHQDEAVLKVPDRSTMKWSQSVHPG